VWAVTIKDKSSIIARAGRGESFKFELGCGPRKVDRNAIGIDMLDFPDVEIVGDIFEVLEALPAGCATAIYSAHFFEHVADLPRLLRAVERMLRSGARLQMIVPHFSNPFYHSDPTHRTTFGLYTLAYFCPQQLFRRSIPRYGEELQLRLDGVSLGFKSYPPRYLRHALKRAWGLIFDKNMYMREFYEENLCWVVPCYEIRYDLVKE
jgi:hypothetical protein